MYRVIYLIPRQPNSIPTAKKWRDVDIVALIRKRAEQAHAVDCLVCDLGVVSKRTSK
jgi:hypothetical protein